MPLIELPWLPEIGGADPGTIAMWSGTIASIPSGWQLCDGTNGSPDLRSKFARQVVDAVTDPGTTGGADDVTLATSQLPAHNHTISSYTHSHRVTGGTSDGTGGLRRTNDGDSDDSRNSESADPPDQNLISTGGGGSHNNLPPYFELVYIFKL